MSIGLLGLLDDVTALAKVAAASIDDVAGQAAKAGLKAAGAVIDDTAVTPNYVTGFTADRVADRRQDRNRLGALGMTPDRVRQLLGGPARIARAAYARLRRYLPDAEVVLYGGLRSPVRRKLGDRWLTALVPDWKPDLPHYEQGLTTGLRQTVRSGDRVIVIGGGTGITAALAAQLSGATVICYEGAIERIAEIQLTARRNGVGEQVDAREAIVGVPFDIYGGTPTTTFLSPADLPDCDVLEVDCEGSERSILAAMSIRPRAIVVETHGIHGVPTAMTRRQLETFGYTVSDLGIAEPDMWYYCETNDIRVLVGVLT